MQTESITCPHCGESFALSEALTHNLRAHWKAEHEQDLKKLEQKVRSETQQKTREELDLRLKELEQGLAEKEAKLKASQQEELSLRKKAREVEQMREEMELNIARALDEQRKTLSVQMMEKFQEEQRLKHLEKDKKIADLMQALEEARRKAEQGSMETQGEVLELDLEAQLREWFPMDGISPVNKGARGGDITQEVRTQTGTRSGMILWETKNTKQWSHQWIPKLKMDLAEVGGQLAVLVSRVLPEGVERFGLHEGVWVAQAQAALPLACALREQLLAVERERVNNEGKQVKMEMLYDYLAGDSFRQRVNIIVETFVELKAQLETERRSMERQWKQRDRQLERVIKSTSGMYGEMQGIIGSGLPNIQLLSLDQLPGLED